MKKILYITALFLGTCLTASSGDEKQEPSKEEVEVNNSKPVTYVIGIVKRGENWNQDSLRAFQLQEQHLKFLQNLIIANKLIASGPLRTSSDARGLYVFNVETVREAEILTSKDEAMSSGWIAMDFHVWDSRDYKVPETTIIEEDDQNQKGWGIGATSIVFAVVITIFVIRTFRYKANV